MPIKKRDKDSLFLNQSPLENMKNLSDEDVVEQLEIALSKGWNVQCVYGSHSSYNALHVCAIKGHVKACIWLLDKGLDPNFRSGNENTAFTFVLDCLHDKEKNVDVEKFLYFAKKLKEYGADLSLSGYEKKTPLELYTRYNRILDEEVINLLIENANFEGNFSFNVVLKENKYFNYKMLKRIISSKKINLKEIIYPNENSLASESYWDTISLYMKGKNSKESFEKINWLHEKVGFDLDQTHTINEYDYDRDKDKIIKVNLLGVAVQARNKNMFQWIMKKRPEFINSKFIIDNKEYNFLEFSVLCHFRYGIQFALRQMNVDELLASNSVKFKNLADGYLSVKTFETFEKTQTALLYKKMAGKYEEKNIKVKTLKI